MHRGDLNHRHLKVFLARSALWTGPVHRHIFPQGARRNPFISWDPMNRCNQYISYRLHPKNKRPAHALQSVARRPPDEMLAPESSPHPVWFFGLLKIMRRSCSWVWINLYSVKRYSLKLQSHPRVAFCVAMT